MWFSDVMPRKSCPVSVRVLYLLLACGLQPTSVGLEVEVTVQAAWPAASLAAELLEGLAEVGRGAAFLRALSGSSSSRWRQDAAKHADAALCCQGKSAYGRLLSLRARHSFSSAVVEAARGMERADRAILEEQGRLDALTCPVGQPWVMLHSKGGYTEVFCGKDLAKLSKTVLTGKPGKSVGRLSGAPRRSGLDHVLYEFIAEEDSYPELIGYGDLGDPSGASELLKALLEAADALATASSFGRVAFRHGTPAGDAPPAVLGGYGLELMTRSADEVAKSKDDDSPQEAEDEVDGRCLREVSDPAESFHGIDIAAIAKHFPDTASALCRLRSDLVTQAEKPLLPWELTRLGARAAMRAVRLSNDSSLQGLLSLGEVAQDYPSGWGRALSAGTSEDSQTARELMEDAEAIKGDDTLQVNGWQVPEKQRGLLPVLRAQLPLFRSAELLASSGISQSGAFALLRDARSGPAVPSRVNTGDPRMEKKGKVPSFLLDKQNPVLLGLGFVIDPCSRKQLKIFNAIIKRTLPAMAWLRLQSSTHSAVAAVLQSALEGLLSDRPGIEAATRLLVRFAEDHASEEENLCGEDAVKRIKGLYKKAFQQYQYEKAKKLKTSDDSSSLDLRFPTPSVSVNGKMIVGLENMEKLLESEIQQEVQQISFAFQMMRTRPSMVPEKQILNFAYSNKHFHPSSFRIQPKLLTAWYPGISTSPIRHVPLQPDILRKVPGGQLQGKSSRPYPAVHLAVLHGDTKLLQDFREVLGAFAVLSSLSGSRPSPKRYLHVAITAGCGQPVGSPLPTSGALRRCVAAASTSGFDQLTQLLDALQTLPLADVTAEMLLTACGASLPHKVLQPKAATVVQEDVERCQAHLPILRDVGVLDGTMLLVNGRLFGPLELDGQSFTAGIVAHAEELELDFGPMQFQDGLVLAEDAVVKMLKQKAGSEDYLLAFALAVRARSVVESFAARSGETTEEKSEDGEQLQDSHRQGVAEVMYERAPPGLRMHLAPREVSFGSPIRVYALLNPLGKGAQRLPPLLALLHQELNAEVFVTLRPVRLAESPLTGYFRTAATPIAPEGGLAALGEWNGTMKGVRIELPPRRGQLLSVQLVAPDDWLCSPVDSAADLDSIPAHAPRGSPGAKVHVRYEVEALFLEGVAEDARGSPATGRQLALAPLRGVAETAGSNSVVVKSGYFQLRQKPGVYQLSLHSNEERLLRPKGLVQLADLAGRGSLLEARVGKIGLGEDAQASFFKANDSESTQNFEGAGGDPAECSETIHIFSVASGLRYERLLRIMMLSVRKHTKCKLRFWLVENFLSPRFRRILPGLAEQVGFAVSRVTYKWPTWLREQTQKQRVIWAYKILFLDVFFPAEVKRILFIDADQIVRANVEELWRMDIKGHVYGFVPFCGSGPPESLTSHIWGSLTGKAAKQEDLKNPDTVGFRFWEQGFWKNHLAGRHYYHISALFVVDLEVFRQTGAGDTLRDVYQSLTADPHSLANLDQDLPNYIQANLPIYSLPQEWLWCESWCSESSKTNAKTIDMCQHPSKKEGKLQQARRIAPEWVQYDDELQSILDKLDL